MGRLQGKVAIVTGGTSGIGRATAVQFAREGAKITIVGRRQSEGDDVVQEIRRAGGSAIFVQGSVADVEVCRRMVDETVAAFGKLDIAFNNAGIAQTPGPLAEVSEEQFDQIIDINLKGVFLSMKYEIPALLQSGGGSIINTSSVAGKVGSIHRSVYTASKHGVIGITRTAALEYAARGIRANALCLGLIETEMMADWTDQQRQEVLAYHPIGRTGSLEEIAETVLFLASAGSGFITGAAISADGGVTAQ